MKGGARMTVTPGFAFATNPDLDPLEIGEAEVRSAYRMDLPHHLGSTHSCKRNCRANPSCISGLGERSWLEAEEEEESDGELEDEMVRKTGVPAGLRNLGNTCYVNSFLQIWFHNLQFRAAMYQWDPSEDPVEAENETILEQLYEPRSKVASLQVLFAMMQYTKRKFIDPADFITKLGLNPSVQQDAQEFSKLFISLLEDSLAHQSSAPVRTMIQKQFRGEYAYVTTCQACLRESVRPSHFYELDLALAGGNKTIADCLKDFLKVERMTGDEKYFCEGCQCKQEASRCCRLRELPNTLNLQLNRFQYDMNLGRKKKLNSNIQFPETLDMSEYLGPGQEAIYCLTGVLMHVGPDANHGHYIAHIQELDSGLWFKFSDETVVPLASKQLRLGGEEELLLAKKGKVKAPPVKSGVQNSNNAYMLVYMLQDSLKETRAAEEEEKMKREAVLKAEVAGRAEGGEPEDKRRRLGPDYSSEYTYSNCRVFPANFPLHLRTKMERDNLEFDEEHEERMTSRQAERRESRNKQARMVKQYSGLKWPGGGLSSEQARGPSYHRSFECLPVTWIMRWLANPLTCGPIETKHLLCIHKNLDIDKVIEMKVCEATTVGCLYASHGEGEGPRLTHERLCEVCVRNKARTISLEAKMTRDQGFLHHCESPCDGTGFWVGKRSFQQWKRYAKVALEDRIINEVHSPARSSKARAGKVQEVAKEQEESFCLTDLQAKLQKMGTNVSLAHQDLSGKGGAGCLTGLSVIKNGEAFKMASVAEMKMNLSEEERKAWSKPVQAVRPMPKAPKPSATVKPFVKSEGISEMEDKAKEDTELVMNTEVTNGSEVKSSGNTRSEEGPSRSIGNGDNVEVNGVKDELIVKSESVVTEKGDTEVTVVTENGLPACAGLPPSSLPTSPPKPTAKVAPDLAAQEDIFNADILCPHNNLRIEQRVRQLISRPAWHRVSSYFSRPITFQFGTPVCGLCEEELNAANLQKDQWKEEAAVQRARLADLFGDKDRPKWSKKTTVKVFLLSYSFVASWRCFIKGRLAGKAGTAEAITDISNKTLLCEHGGLLHPPTIGWEAVPDPNVVMISEEEWEVVQDMFAVDMAICVDRENGPGGPVLTSCPPPCSLCVASRQEAEQEDRLRYKNSIVFVRRISPDEKVPDLDSHADPEYCSSPVMGEAPPPSRRSHRRPKVRGEREFLVHSDMKLRDFKVKLMEAFKVAPYDQNLMVNGVYLTDNNMSLGQLKVLPGSLIFLRADEPTHIAPYHSEEVTSQHEEQGFKGTGLLSN